MAILSDQRWRDPLVGLREMRRVARRGCVPMGLQGDPALLAGSRLPPRVRDDRRERAAHTGGASEHARRSHQPRLDSLGLPRRLLSAYWRRPDAYLDEGVRRGTSVCARLGPAVERRSVTALREDLANGRWGARNAELLKLEEADFSARLLISDHRQRSSTPPA